MATAKIVMTILMFAFVHGSSIMRQQHRSAEQCKCPALVPLDCKSFEKCPKMSKDECECPVMSCADAPAKKNNVRPPKPPIEQCSKQCSTCTTCKWVWDPRCEIWEESCEHGCPPYGTLYPPHAGYGGCYEYPKTDRCGCTMPAVKKPCDPDESKRKCPPRKPIRKDGVDDCGCPGVACFECPSLNRPIFNRPPWSNCDVKMKREYDCSKCETFVPDQDPTCPYYHTECQIGTCVKKPGCNQSTAETATWQLRRQTNATEDERRRGDVKASKEIYDNAGSQIKKTF